MSKRSAQVAVILAASLLTGCTGGGPGPTGTTVNAVPASSSTDTPSPSATLTACGSASTDAEALAHAVAPTTGERWFGKPRPIPAPTWVNAEKHLGDDEVAILGHGVWWELGTRGTSTIVGATPYGDAIAAIFERSAAAVYTQIDRPAANWSLGEYSTLAVTNSTVSHDAATHYDSFCVPASVDLPSGEPITLQRIDLGDLVSDAGTSGAAGEAVTTVRSIGGFTIVKYTSPGAWVWDEIEGVAAPPGLTFVDSHYGLRTPWGTELWVRYRPFGESAEKVTWFAGYPLTASSPGHADRIRLADISDTGCDGSSLPDRISGVHGLAENDWVAAGSDPLGRTVYLPTTANPLLESIYGAARAFGFGDQPDEMTMADFVLERGLIGYRTPWSEDWLVFVNANLGWAGIPCD